MPAKLFLDFCTNSLCVFNKDDNNQLDFLLEKSIDTEQTFIHEELIDTIRPFIISNSVQKFTWFSSEFTVIPSALFLPNHLENYYSLNFGEVNQNQKLSYDSLNDVRMCIVYSIPKWLSDFKQGYFFNSEIKHHASLLVKNTLKSPYENLISIVFEGSSFLMCIKKDNKLLICNSFDYQDEEDLLYFIVTHHNQLKLADNSVLSLMSYKTEFNKERVLELLSHFKELSGYVTNFHAKIEYNSTLTCE